MLDLDPAQDNHRPPILRTVANQNTGLPELVESVLDLLKSSKQRRVWQEVRIREELIGLLEKELTGLIRDQWEKDGGLEKAVRQIERRERDPYSIVQERLDLLFQPIKKVDPSG